MLSSHNNTPVLVSDRICCLHMLVQVWNGLWQVKKTSKQGDKKLLLDYLSRFVSACNQCLKHIYPSKLIKKASLFNGHDLAHFTPGRSNLHTYSSTDLYGRSCWKCEALLVQIELETCYVQ